MIQQLAVPRVVLEVLGVFLDHVRILGFTHVMKDIAELHLPEACEMRAVRIALFVGECMVLTMDRYPFLDDDACRQPQGQAKAKRHDRNQNDRAMCDATMQVNRRAEHGDLNDDSSRDERQNQGRGQVNTFDVFEPRILPQQQQITERWTAQTSTIDFGAQKTSSFCTFSHNISAQPCVRSNSRINSLSAVTPASGIAL